MRTWWPWRKVDWTQLTWEERMRILAMRSRWNWCLSFLIIASIGWHFWTTHNLYERYRDDVRSPLVTVHAGQKVVDGLKAHWVARVQGNVAAALAPDGRLVLLLNAQMSQSAAHLLDAAGDQIWLYRSGTRPLSRPRVAGAGAAIAVGFTEAGQDILMLLQPTGSFVSRLSPYAGLWALGQDGSLALAQQVEGGRFEVAVLSSAGQAQWRQTLPGAPAGLDYDGRLLAVGGPWGGALYVGGVPTWQSADPVLGASIHNSAALFLRVRTAAIVTAAAREVPLPAPPTGVGRMDGRLSFTAGGTGFVLSAAGLEAAPPLPPEGADVLAAGGVLLRLTPYAQRRLQFTRVVYGQGT
ncbi:MAG: hypothetical protein AB1492_07045 [Bacillota bacterium]